MIYPKFLKKGDYIGITAPSDGITNYKKIRRLDNAINNLEKLNFKVIETNNVRTSIKGRSSSASKQASELMTLYKSDLVKVIICATGGDFLLEMLPWVDFEAIKKHVKWLQGYSDPTGLLYTITTNLDIATIYGDNICAFGMTPWHKSLNNNLEILQGNIVEQFSYNKYEEYTLYDTGLESYNLVNDVYWNSLNGESKIKIKGRIIGGCLDIIAELFGTRFDKTKEFIEKYKEDGIIWYFDNCELTSESLIRVLWKIKDNGYFKYAKGIIFGRSATNKSYYDISFEEALKHSLNELNIPIILDADIGHIAPRMTIINGAIANITYSNHKGSISFLLE